jgi:hypothetical protein
MDWMMPIDSRITYEFDALRWDKRTAGLFRSQWTADAARDVRSHAEILNRVAAVHFWLQNRILASMKKPWPVRSQRLKKLRLS